MNGIINVRKEKGFTSFDVVAKLRGILKMKKIGHTGTLDPDAEGVLPVCIGKATKVCELLTDKDKEYRAVMLLGQVTDTQDITGTVLSKKPVSVSKEEAEQCIMGFVGGYQQIPPMYSALKVNGRKLCDLAREGIEVERKPRLVHIHAINIEEIELPRVTMRVHCSKGTYIRTLCQDIGEKLGCGACMESLVRTRVADFKLEDAKTLAEIETIVSEQEIESILYPIDSVFMGLPEAVIRRQYHSLLYNGNKLSVSCCMDWDSGREGKRLRVYDEDKNFVGIYQHMAEEKMLKLIKMFGS